MIKAKNRNSGFLLKIQKFGILEIQGFVNQLKFFLHWLACKAGSFRAGRGGGRLQPEGLEGEKPPATRSFV